MEGCCAETPRKHLSTRRLSAIACLVQAERLGGEGEAEWRAEEQHPGPQLRGHQESGVLHQQLRGGQRSRPARTRSRLQAGRHEAAAVLRDQDQGVPVLQITASAPCSRQILMHYSFDYAQQIHLPSDPMLPGPLYFLVPQEVRHLWGVL